MILADKIMELRKKNHWSQEELAEKLGVSRQAISKWESAQSTPDLKKILAMSELFEVSTDYLIKDELEIEEAPEGEGDPVSPLIKLSMEEANRFIEARSASAKPLAFGVWLCVLAVIPLILGDDLGHPLGEGLSYLISGLMVVGGVVLFLLTHYRLKEFEWLSEEPFETAYGVDGMVKEKRQAFKGKYVSSIIIGVVLSILTLISFMMVEPLSMVLGIRENILLGLAFALAGCGVYFFVSAGLVNGTYTKLLQEDDYQPHKKRFNKKVGPLIGIYWLLVTAVYLAYSFTAMNWEISWIIWPVAGVLNGVLYLVLEMVYGRRH